eukprot:4346809-Heterocapsa_arctica.AAC.1
MSGNNVEGKGEDKGKGTDNNHHNDNIRRKYQEVAQQSAHPLPIIHCGSCSIPRELFNHVAQ